LHRPGCCSCGGVAAPSPPASRRRRRRCSGLGVAAAEAPSPPAPTVAAEGQGSRLASLAEASSHQHHRESAADPRQPPANRCLRRRSDSSAALAAKPGPPRYGCSRDSRMAPWRRVGRDSRASPRLRSISIVENQTLTRRVGAAAPSVGGEIDCSTPIPWHNHGSHEQHEYDSETAAPQPLLVWKHHSGGGVAAKASTPPVAADGLRGAASRASPNFV